MAEQFYPTALRCMCLVQCGDAILIEHEDAPAFAESLCFPGGAVGPSEAVSAAATRLLHAACGLKVTTWQHAGFVNRTRADGRKELIFLCAATLPAAASSLVKNEANEARRIDWQALIDIDDTQMSAVGQAVFDAWQAGAIQELTFL